MLHRGRRVLHRRVLRRLMDHRSTRADRTSCAPTGARGRCVPADRTSSGAAALNDRPRSGRALAHGTLSCGCMPDGPGRAAVTRNAASPAGAAASPECGAVLADDAAVRSAAGRDASVGAAREPAAGTRARGTAGVTAQFRAANTGARRTARVATQACTAGNRGGRRGNCHMAAESALTTQRGRAARTSDAQASAARRRGAALTADTDAAERTRYMRSRSTVQCSAFASDQPRLTARAGTQCGITCCPESRLAAEIGGTRQLAAGAEAAGGLGAEIRLAAERARVLRSEPAGRLTTGAERAASLARATETATDTTAAAKTRTGLAGQPDTGLRARLGPESAAGLTHGTEAAAGTTAEGCASAEACVNVAPEPGAGGDRGAPLKSAAGVQTDVLTKTCPAAETTGSGQPN